MKGITVVIFVVSAAFVYVADASTVGVDECPPEQEHDWSIEHLMRHEVCNMYYHCVYGQPVERYCPSNLYFDLLTWRCEWPHLVDCQDRIIPPPPTVEPTTPEPITPEPTTPEPTTPEPTTPEPTTPEPTTPKPTTPEPTTPEPTTPEPTTPEPTTPEPTTPEPTTPETTTPKPTTPEPTTPEPTTPKPTTPEPTQEPTTLPAPTTQSGFQDNGCPVDPHIHWLLPHEYDCNLFYYCVWGQKVLRQCPDALHFNARIQVCDYDYRAGCTLLGNPIMNKLFGLY